MYRKSTTSRNIAVRVWALTSVALLVWQMPAGASPGEIFATAAPVQATGMSNSSATPDPSQSPLVATKMGALEYSYPIRVPAGRQGMEPSLALSYSSLSPIYGTIAAGWSLSIPIVTLDTASGRLAGPRLFKSSLAGVQRLVPVAETLPAGSDGSFRAQGDTAFTRYLHGSSGSSYKWLAQTIQGVSYYFGQTTNIRSCTIVSDAYAPLTSTVDAFGNVVNYVYEAGVVGECRISTISWGKNPNANTADFAQVSFGYGAVATCASIPVGSETSYRSGIKIVTGASPLSSISVTAFAPGLPSAPIHRRTISLGYSSLDSSCTRNYSAFRSLSSIQESASSIDSPTLGVSLPPVLFAYGQVGLNYSPRSESVPWHNAWGGTNLLGTLSWGQRFISSKWPTVEAMMVDIDGDGLVDRVTNDSVNTDGRTSRCGASWERNLGPGLGFDGVNHHIDLPTLKWGSPSTIYSGGAYANQDASDESCSLNYQQTSYVNSHGNAGTNIGCPPSFSSCPSVGYCTSGGYGNDCGQKYGAADTILAYRWLDIDGDGLIDIVASVAQGGLAVYNMQWGNGVPGHLPAPAEPPLFGNFPPCPTVPYSDAWGSNTTYTMCNGMYPWFVYKNKGQGMFGDSHTGAVLPDLILYQPTPLETTTGDSSITGPVVGNREAVADLDGDGISDGVATASGNQWQVFRGSTSLAPLAPSTVFSVGPADSAITATSSAFGVSSPTSSAGLIDVNGDGLLDHWNGTGTSVNIELNNGASFSQITPTTTLRPGNDGIPSSVCSYLGTFLTDCTRVDSSRTIDADFDGRDDLSRLPGTCANKAANACLTTSDCGGSACTNAGSTLSTYLNEGGQFASQAVQVMDAAALKHEMHASSHLGPTFTTNPYTWDVRSDMIDIDGDGIPEGVTFGVDGSLQVARYGTITQPPRLLVNINNGLGAVTSVSYASTSNQSVVTQASSSHLPRPRWVVATITTSDLVSGTLSTSQQTYRNSVWNADDDGHYDFRGFESTSTKSPSGAQTVEAFDYNSDWRGLPVKKALFATEDLSHPVWVDVDTWEPRTLYAGTVKTFHRLSFSHGLCGSSQSENDCVVSPSLGVQRTSVKLSACANTFGMSGATCDASTVARPDSVLWIETQRLNQLSAQNADGDHRLSTTYAVVAPVGTLDYRVRSLASTGEVRGQSAFTLFEKSAHSWDPTYRVPLTDEKWFDAADSTRAVTRREYDLTTGNVRKRWKPVQNDAGTGYASYDYDDRKLFVTAEHSEPTGVNQSSESVTYSYDYGTGTKIETQGPNIATCAGAAPYTSPTCPPGTTFTQSNRVRVDGLGRVIERWASVSSPNNVSYQNLELEKINYSTGYPVAITTLRGIDYDSSSNVTRYSQHEDRLDGLGRVSKSIDYALGAASADAITTYGYDNAGNRVSVIVPDPSLNSTNTATYQSTFDSLGRELSLRRPDDAALAGKSGYDKSYVGLAVKTTEILGTRGGTAAETTTTTDILGRVRAVSELRSGSTTAVTAYDYDAGDNLTKVTDPAGVVTTTSHDFAGRRLTVTRNAAVWSFGYDKNGNIVSQTFPGATPLTISKFINTTAYDDLDRPVSESVGQRNLSDSDYSTMEGGFRRITWDVSADEIGNIGTDARYVNSSGLPRTYTTFHHDSQGRVTQAALFVAGMYTGSNAGPTRAYNLRGGVSRITYNDYQSMSANDSASIAYDNRGLAQSMILVQSGASPKTIAVETRNVAGLVTGRRGEGSGPLLTYVASTWNYDTLGRVTSQAVEQGPGPVQVVRQDMAYFGNDNVLSLDNWLGPANHKKFNYSFDARHELTTVSESLLPNAFRANYSYGLAGRFVSATETVALLPNSAASSQDVSYQYGGTDPEQVTSLVNSDGSVHWCYAYDTSGNEIVRCAGAISAGLCTGGSESDFVYDGKDQLRRSTVKIAGVVRSVEEYSYDGSGQRIITIKKAPDGTVQDTILFHDEVETHYTNSYTFGHSVVTLGLDSPVARIDTSVAGFEYVFSGMSNSLLAAVSYTSGLVDASFSYAPYGQIIEATDNGNANTGISAHRNRFNGKYADENSSLIYYGRRYYDKTSMAWTQRDPKFAFVPELARSTSPRQAYSYQFSLNNPLRYFDPDGREAVQDRPGEDGKRDTRCNGSTSFCEGATNDSNATVQDVATAVSEDTLAQAFPPLLALEVGDSVLGNRDHRLFNLGTRAMVAAGVGWIGGGLVVEGIAGFSVPSFLGGAGAGVGALEAGTEIETEAPQAYEIIDGVRRAKATEIACAICNGPNSIEAEIFAADGSSMGTANVPLTSLFSPNKSVIDTAGQGLSRWIDVLKGAMQGDKLRPITVTPGSRGTPLSKVEIE